jgi:hypothetical protein
MKAWALRIAVVAILIAAAFLLRGRNQLPETPEAAVNALFEAAKDGDHEAYLRLLGGKIRAELEETRRQQGADVFGDHLRSWSAGVKNFAVVRIDESSPERVLLELDITFTDRNERQRMVASRQDDGWIITEMGTTEVEKPPVPYGTSVFGPAEEEQSSP